MWKIIDDEEPPEKRKKICDSDSDNNDDNLNDKTLSDSDNNDNLNDEETLDDSDNNDNLNDEYYTKEKYPLCYSQLTLINDLIPAGNAKTLQRLKWKGVPRKF